MLDTKVLHISNSDYHDEPNLIFDIDEKLSNVEIIVGPFDVTSDGHVTIYSSTIYGFSRSNYCYII